MTVKRIFGKPSIESIELIKELSNINFFKSLLVINLLTKVSLVSRFNFDLRAPYFKRFILYSIYFAFSSFCLSFKIFKNSFGGALIPRVALVNLGSEFFFD